MAEKDKTAKRDEDQQAGRKERAQADLVSYKQAQKCIKLEAVDCQMLLKGQTRGEKRKKEKKRPQVIKSLGKSYGTLVVSDPENKPFHVSLLSLKQVPSGNRELWRVL